MMSRKPVDLELPQRVTANQGTWLEATSVPVRSIRFSSCGVKALYERRV